MKTKTPLQIHVDRLIVQHQGVRAAARAAGVDPGYLWKIAEGTKVNPSAKTLKKLGLEKVELVRRIRG